MPISSSIADDLDLVKSAAWAWYERGSGSYRKPAREFDFSRTKIHHKPSRYKQELMAIRNAENRASVPLLDKYEVERITKQLDDIFMKSNHKDKNRGRDVVVEKSTNDKFGLKKERSNDSRLSFHGLMCGSTLGRNVSGEKELRNSGIKGHRRIVSVVELEVCRPRWGSRA